MEALIQEDNNLMGIDYILQEGHNHVWLTVNNISIYIVKRDDGVSIQCYPLGHEMNDCITETWVTWGEGEIE